MGLAEVFARMSKPQQIVSVVGVGMTSTLVFCCGGLGALGAIVGPAPSKSPAPPTSKIGVVATPAERSETPLTESPSPSPSQSPSPSDSPSPTAVPTTEAPPPVQTTNPAPPPPPPPVRTTTNAAPPPPPPPPPAGPPTHSGYIRGGAFCKVAEEGWIGYDASGREYVCRDIDNNGHPHWVLP